MRWAIKEKKLWNRWFAWYPVQLSNHLVWLENVQRTKIYIPGTVCSYWEYAEVDNGH